MSVSIALFLSGEKITQFQTCSTKAVNIKIANKDTQNAGQPPKQFLKKKEVQSTWDSLLLAELWLKKRFGHLRAFV